MGKPTHLQTIMLPAGSNQVLQNLLDCTEANSRLFKRSEMKIILELRIRICQELLKHGQVNLNDLAVEQAVLHGENWSEEALLHAAEHVTTWLNK